MKLDSSSFSDHLVSLDLSSCMVCSLARSEVTYVATRRVTSHPGGGSAWGTHPGELANAPVVLSQTTEDGEIEVRISRAIDLIVHDQVLSDNSSRARGAEATEELYAPKRSKATIETQINHGPILSSKSGPQWGIPLAGKVGEVGM
uniref:Uncharacterized protein n=1 Tax=Timema genevievae TaxID=629358 RepID=A0A7R9K3B1_TIMGE|nr:unnamed protein product [Timema genevievae]